MANPIKWNKTRIDFPTTEVNVAQLAEATCYNAQIEPESFNASVASPFAFRDSTRTAYYTSLSTALSNKKFSIIASDLSVPALVNATVVDSITDGEYVCVVGEFDSLASSKYIYVAIFDAVTNTKKYVSTVTGAGSPTVAEFGISRMIVDVGDFFVFPVNKQTALGYEADLYYINKSTGALGSIDVPNEEGVADPYINGIAVSHDKKTIYLCGYSTTGPTAIIYKFSYDKNAATKFTAEYNAGHFFGGDANTKYQYTAIDIQEYASYDSANNNYILSVALKVVYSGTNVIDYAINGAIDTGSAISASIATSIDNDDIDTIGKCIECIDDKVYFSDFSLTDSEQSKAYRYSGSYYGLKLGTTSSVDFDHASIGKTSNIGSLYVKMECNIVRNSLPTGVNFFAFGSNLIFRINGTGSINMIDATGTVFSESTTTLPVASLLIFEVERYYDSDLGSYEWKLTLNGEELTLTEEARYAVPIAIDSGETISIGQGFSSATGGLACSKFIAKLEGITVLDIDFNNPLNPNATTYPANALSATTAEDFDTAFGLYLEEESANLGGIYYDMIPFYVNSDLYFSFYGSDITANYCSTQRRDVNLDLESVHEGHYDQFETTGHVLYTGDSFYNGASMPSSGEKMFFFTVDSDEIICCFSKNIDSDFTSNTELFSFRALFGTAGTYTDDLDVDVNNDLPLSVTIVEDQGYENANALILTEFGEKDFYKIDNNGTDREQEVSMYVKDLKLKNYYDNGNGGSSLYLYNDVTSEMVVNASGVYEKACIDTNYQGSNNDYDSYLDTINIYYDPAAKEELLKDNALIVAANFAVSMLKAEITWAVDSNYKFNSFNKYWSLGEIEETGRIEPTYAGDYTVYAQGSKQVEIKTTDIDDRSANCIKVRIEARLTDDSDPANTYYDEFKIFSINLLPTGLFYFEGEDNA